MTGERIPAGRVEVIHAPGGTLLEAEAGLIHADDVHVRTERGLLVGFAESQPDGTWRYLTREDNGIWPPTGESVADSRDAALIQLGIALAKKYQR